RAVRHQSLKELTPRFLFPSVRGASIAVWVKERVSHRVEHAIREWRFRQLPISREIHRAFRIFSTDVRRQFEPSDELVFQDFGIGLGQPHFFDGTGGQLKVARRRLVQSFLVEIFVKLLDTLVHSNRSTGPLSDSRVTSYQQHRRKQRPAERRYVK